MNNLAIIIANNFAGFLINLYVQIVCITSYYINAIVETPHNFVQEVFKTRDVLISMLIVISIKYCKALYVIIA